MRQYRRLVELLERELETEPDPETTALFQRLQGSRFDGALGAPKNMSTKASDTRARQGAFDEVPR